MTRTLWKPALGLSLALLTLPADVFAGGRGGGMSRGGGNMNRGGEGGGSMNRGGEGGGSMNRGGYGGSSSANHSPSFSSPRSPSDNSGRAGSNYSSDRDSNSAVAGAANRNQSNNPYAAAGAANRSQSNNPYAAAGAANRNQSTLPNSDAAAAGAGYANRNQPNYPNAGAAAAGAGYANRNQPNYPNAGAAAAGAAYANRNQPNYPNAGAAAAGAAYANNNQYHPGMVNGYWNSNYGMGGSGAVGAWGTGSPMYGYGYAPYSNPYMAGGPAVGGGGQPGAQAQVNAPAQAASQATNYSQPINTAAAPPDQSVSDPATTAFNQARDAFRSGDYVGAQKLTQQALTSMPNDSTMHQFLGLVLFAQGNYEQAAAPLYAVLSVGPGWDWTTLIENYADANVYTEQMRGLEGFLRTNPKSAAAYFVLAYHYITQGHDKNAVEVLKRVVALQPNDTLSAQLLASLQPSGAPATDASGPVAPVKPVDPGKLAGRWVAEAPQNTRVMLTIKDDGSFTWALDRPGQPTSTIAGTMTLADGLLTLNDKDGKSGALAGQVASQDDDHFSFRVVGAPQNDPGLKFAR
jgi:tetratricopeptide (TPR) repeat protein